MNVGQKQAATDCNQVKRLMPSPPLRIFSSSSRPSVSTTRSAASSCSRRRLISSIVITGSELSCSDTTVLSQLTIFSIRYLWYKHKCKRSSYNLMRLYQQNAVLFIAVCLHVKHKMKYPNATIVIFMQHKNILQLSSLFIRPIKA